jgi:peptidyl-prolyl cis-trans isomerase A (cyclophilin A)
MKAAFCSMFLVAVTLGGCLGAGAQQTPPATKPVDPDSQPVSPPAKAPAEEIPDSPAPQAAALVHPNGPTVVFDTSMGRMTCQFYQAQAPNTVANFIGLAEGTKDWTDPATHKKMHHKPLYDGTTFHRVIPGFMAQFGINPDPKVSAVWQNENIVDDPVKESNKRAYVTFAKASAPNTRSTQVFINYKSNDFLDPQGFAPFGEVIEGMENADKFYSGYGGNPDQGALQQLGKSYIDKNMPKVYLIKIATIVPLVAPVAATKSTAAKAPATKSTTAKQ